MSLAQYNLRIVENISKRERTINVPCLQKWATSACFYEALSVASGQTHHDINKMIIICIFLVPIQPWDVKMQLLR